MASRFNFFKRGLMGAAALTVTVPRVFSAAALCDEPRTKNLVLGDQSVPEAERKHRVGLASWCHTGMKRELHGISSIAELFDHAKATGYDGLEAGLGDLRSGNGKEGDGYVPKGISDRDLITIVKAESERTGVKLLGALYLVLDGNKPFRDFDLDWNDPEFEQKMAKQIKADKQAGCEYITFQMCLPPRYLNTGGAYRDDKEFLALCAKRIGTLQKICFENDMNCYVETHVDRITEDLGALCEILDHPDCPDSLEINGDLSHYIYRGWTDGPYIEKVLSRLGHTHQRMARVHGDLSAVVANLKEDWGSAEGGRDGSVTRQAWTLLKKALDGSGLSSRAIVGEAGPIHLVENSLEQNDRLVPLFRFMSCYADQKCTDEKDASQFF